MEGVVSGSVRPSRWWALIQTSPADKADRTASPDACDGLPA